MQSKIPKTLAYPLIILSLVAFIVVSVFFFLNSIGVRMNPPQPAFEFEEEITTAVLWRGDTGDWKLSEKGRLSIFDTDNKRFENSGSALRLANSDKFGDVAFFIVRASLDKEKSRELLSALSKFSLKKVYIASPYDDTMSALKKLEPRFWYAASPRSWVKWSLFETFGIEKAFTLEADFAFVDDEISKLMSPRLVDEIKRRRLPMITAKENETLRFN